METRRALVKAPPAEQTVSAPRVVFTQAPIVLGRLVAKDERGYVVRIGEHETPMEADPEVAPVLLTEALARGSRVVVDTATQTICGLLVTAPSLAVDANGDVIANVRRLEISAEERVLLKTRASFVQLDDARVEVYARETLLRARGALRALARLIKLN